jgi:hypothetical protein
VLPPLVPLAGSARWQRPFLHWVLPGEFPSCDGTMALCDSRAPLAALRCLRLAIPYDAPVGSLPSVQDARPRGWGSYSGPHYRNHPQGSKQDLPGSRTTLWPYALFFDPGRTAHNTPLRCVGMAPAMSTAKAPTIQPSLRGSIAWLWDSLFTLRPARRHARRKTRFWLRARLYQAGLVARRVPTKGFRDASYIASSFPKLLCANDGPFSFVSPAPFPLLLLWPGLAVNHYCPAGRDVNLVPGR